MVKVVGVRFKKVGKIYYFDPDNYSINQGDNVIVETARGLEFGNVVVGTREVDDEEIVTPLKKVIRVATDEDTKANDENRKKEERAYEIFVEKAKKHNLTMQLLDVEYTFDNSKVLFYFTAEGRIDFRELVKDLASIFRTRIELRQIGVRDESKVVGGLGICGRSFCCNSFLGDFSPISIKMAKDQSLSLNPTKISGVCGRLMCCLEYEENVYEDILKYMPGIGAIVDTQNGQGMVVETSVLKEKVRVKLDKGDQVEVQEFNLSEIKIIKNVKIEENTEEIRLLKSLED